MDFHNFSCITSQENAKVIGVEISCHTFVMLLPYRVKISDPKVTHFTPMLTLCTMCKVLILVCTCLYRSHLQKPVSMKQKKTQQKVRGSKIMFKMSTIHANTCIQTTTPLRNRWWFRWQWPVLVLRSCTSWNHGCQWWLLPEYSSAEYASAGYPLCFRGLVPFSARWGTGTSCTWHCHHATERDARVYPSGDVAT